MTLPPPSPLGENQAPYAQQQPVRVAYPQQYGYPPQLYIAAPPTNGMAITSFVLSLLGVSILGVIFGHMSLGQIKRTAAGGQGLAVAGLVIGYIGCGMWVLGWLAILVPLISALLFVTAAGATSTVGT